MKLIEPRRRHGRKAFELFFAIMASLRFRSFYLTTTGFGWGVQGEAYSVNSVGGKFVNKGIG